MLLLGATVPGHFTEQHDVYFGIAHSLDQLVPAIKASWPGANVHIDAWRRVSRVGDYAINVVDNKSVPAVSGIQPQLFFINLGGYKENEFDEFHYKLLAVGADKGEAVRLSKQTAFYKHASHGKANSHIDDKYGVDVDDIYAIRDILSPEFKSTYALTISRAAEDQPADHISLGYFKLDKLAGLS